MTGLIVVAYLLVGFGVAWGANRIRMFDSPYGREWWGPAVVLVIWPLMLVVGGFFGLVLLIDWAVDR